MLNSENEKIKRDPANFRDPSSRVFTGNGMVFREIDESYFREYKHLMKTGLYSDLVEEGLIVPHREVQWCDDYLITEADVVPMITYPYEWCFSQIQEAALVTLQINQIARKYGMMLKDASAYNIQVFQDRMRLIDTASFAFYHPGDPWYPYSQFLRHFACPMLLIKYDHPHSAKLSQIYLDGIPVPVTVRRIPMRKRFNTGIIAHILSQSMNYAVDAEREATWSTLVFDSLLKNLAKFIGGMKYKPAISDFTQYADRCGYTEEALYSKKEIVDDMIQVIPGKRFLDLGCNIGTFSIIAQHRGKNIIAVDSDHDCAFIANQHYYKDLLPMIVDLTNPSPGLGWAHQERKPFWDRVGEVDCIMALALIHHLCIRNNVPLKMVVDLFADHAKHLIIEWVPPDDPQARKIMGKKQIIPQYDHDTFRKEFDRKYDTTQEKEIKGVGRRIYLMKRR